MFYTQLKRALQIGLVNVVRNSFVSASVIFVMTISLFVVGLSLLFGWAMSGVINDLREKVDVTVYFVPEATEEQVFEFRDLLTDLSQVREVVYVSKLVALEEYRKRHENDVDILRGLDILNENPFRARLSIYADQSSDFESIARFLENEDIFSNNPTAIIEKIDYYQNREIINRLTSVIDTATFFSQLIIALLVFITFLILFNIIRLIIYLSRDEIKVMRLIGAKDWYIRFPFLMSGAVYGFIGSVIAMALLYPVAYWISPSVERFFGGEGLFVYYTTMFFPLIGILLLIGVIIGVASSYLSTRRYLDD